MADTLTSPAEGAEALCGQCTKCLNASGEKVELFAGIFAPVAAARMVLCQLCGNKRCPHAADCALACTDSNEPGQPGSNYADMPGFQRLPENEIAKQEAQAQDLSTRARALYTPPFKVIEGAIFDSAGHKIADDREGVMRVRGWGRLSYLKDGAELQDAVAQTLADALNSHWRAHTKPVDGQPFVERRRPLTAAEASFEALGVDVSEAAAKEAAYIAMRVERDALRTRVAELEGGVPVLTERVPTPVVLPHPKCDEACYYHCTEGGTRPPSCVAVSAAQGKEAAESALADANVDGLPPPDYFMSEQHGKLLLKYTDQPDDPAYRWKGVWLSPRYEQNAAVRQKAAHYDDLVDRLTGTRFETVGQAVQAAVSVSSLSDALIAGICSRFGMTGVPEQNRVRAVREVLRNGGIEPPR